MKNKVSIYIVLSIVILAIFTLISMKLFKIDSPKEEKKNTYEKVMEKGVIIIGIDEAFPPVTFRDENGEIIGSDIDLAKEAAKRMGVDVKFQPVEWDSIIPALESRKIDIIWSGMGITEEREEQIDFIKYSKGPKGLFFVRADSEIESKEDLSNKVVLNLRASPEPFIPKQASGY